MKYIYLLLFLTSCLFTYSQEDQTVIIDDLKTPDSSGFQLLDIAPSTITRPENPKEFAVSALNLSQNGSTLPQNFAMEFNPLWLFKKYDGIYKYYNINHENQNNYASGILRKLTVSIASTVLDSAKTGISGDINFMVFSVRTNLLTIRTKKQNKDFTNGYAAYNNAVTTLLEDKINTDKLDGKLQVKLVEKNKIDKEYADTTNEDAKNDLLKKINTLEEEIKSIEEEIKLVSLNAIEDFSKTLDTLPDVKKFYKILEDAPLFQLDAAFAYSEAYPDNSYGNRRFNRSGLWMTGTVNFKGLEEYSNRDRFSLLFTARLLQDNVLNDATLLTFNREKAFDWGLKLEYSFEKLIIGVEHLQRSYTNDAIGNSKRTVGTLQYEIAKDIYFTSSYGQNFGPDKPLFTLFGINFGIGKAKLK